MVAIRLVSLLWMRIGGCGAETAGESSLYFARELDSQSLSI